MKFDQCLFGYDDGHRLLSSSISLGTETSLLTELSDLAPGAIFSHSDGYWTGLPVPSIGRYVLMRTWPAPEMPRPGCVWTHALLVEPALLESIENLAILQTLTRRPSTSFDKDHYRELLQVDFSSLPRANLAVDDAVVRRLLASLYASSKSAVEVAIPGELDGPLFAVWSQQWPRLRRNFRFQTATSRSPRPLGSVRFDITAVLASQGSNTHQSDGLDTKWLSTAASDIQEGGSGSLRQFLWHYGRDVRKQRGSFQPLVEVKIIDDSALAASGKRVVDIISRSFPLKEDAAYLKQDLVDGVLVASAQAELIQTVLLREGEPVFPLPTNEGIARLARYWSNKPDEILQLAEIAADVEELVCNSIFALVTSLIHRAEFWPLTHSYPRIRSRMLRENPSLLLADAALDLDSEIFIEHLPSVSAEADGLATLISSLVARDDKNLAKIVFKFFPNIAAMQVVLAANEHASVPKVWFQELVNKPALLLLPGLMGLVSRTSLLYNIIDSLGGLTSEVVAAGTEPWLAALVRAKNDLSEEQQGTLCCFLLALALLSGGDGGLRIVEQTFDFVHRQVLTSKISSRAREIISPLLPDLGWLKGWDLGLRLRVAVVKAFVRFDWSPQSFSELSGDRQVREMLSNAASDVPGGRRYAQASS
ncbi:GAP1-N1 domain-containing protein [Pseudomonas lini]